MDDQRAPAKTPASTTPAAPLELSAQARRAISALTYNSDGLIPAVAQCAETGDVLMLAWMTPVSIERSLSERRAVYWSRSRQDFWRKGDTSGHIQELLEIRVDCDRDALLLKVRQVGAACHKGRRSCFYSTLGADGLTELPEE